jgi:hypothetical protein
MRRTIVTMVAATALVVAGCNGNGDANDEDATDTTTTTADPGPTTTLPDRWTACESVELGYEIDYPADWEVNGGEVLPACTVFDPDPIVVSEATELPLDLAVAIFVDPVDFDSVLPPSPFEEREARQDSEVDGREAARVEVAATGDGLEPPGTRTTRWVVRLGEGQTLFARVTDVGQPDYELKQAVLDEMMSRLTFVEVPEDDGPDPVGEPQEDEVASPGFPTGVGEIAYLLDVRSAAHDGFDRVVLEFDGPDEPSWRVTSVDAPIVEDASGDPVEVEGVAFLELRLTPASGVDLTGPELDVVYDGPDRVGVHGNVVTEVVRVGDFEANLAWVVGLTRPAPFAVAFFDDPLRLVVDVFEA